MRLGKEKDTCPSASRAHPIADDARQENPRFDLLRLTERRYAASRKRAGWARSEVFGRWFRLTRQPGDDGFPVFTLEVQSEPPG